MYALVEARGATVPRTATVLRKHVYALVGARGVTVPRTVTIGGKGTRKREKNQEETRKKDIMKKGESR